MANNNFNSPGNMMGHMSEVFDFFQKFPANTENKNEDTTGNLVKNGRYYDKYANFTEFEDENGNLMLIKYGKGEYNFRGNTYCTYILCNEKTGSREDGVAQIKNRQRIHIKDPERVAKIKESIHAYNINAIKSFKTGGIDDIFKNYVYIDGKEYDNELYILLRYFNPEIDDEEDYDYEDYEKEEDYKQNYIVVLPFVMLLSEFEENRKYATIKPDDPLFKKLFNIDDYETQFVNQYENIPEEPNKGLFQGIISKFFGGN